MASVEDRWYQTVKGEDGKPVLTAAGKPKREKSDRYGTGLRWLVRWREPDLSERKQSFRIRDDADDHAAIVEADKLRGNYLDARAGRILFGTYAVTWMANQTTDPLTKQNVAERLKRYVEPYQLWKTPMHSVKPGTVQTWLGTLDAETTLAATTVGVVYSHVSAILSAAVDDEVIGKNPCKATSVRPPRPDTRKIVPWVREWVTGMHGALPDRYGVFVTLAAGLGLRQGELFGLSPDDVDFLRGWVTVNRQVKLVGNKLVFALPKGRKIRRIPLPTTVKEELAAYLALFPAKTVTLPWETFDGKATTVSLAVTTRESGACRRNHFNEYVWHAGQEKVGIPAGRENGMHALRHRYASVLLDAGESIMAVSEYLGHSSASITLKYYAHLMPASESRTRAAIDAAFRTSNAPSVPQGGDPPALTSAYAQ